MLEGKKAVREAIESGLCTRGRLRILRVLAEKPNELFTKYALEKETGLRSPELKTDLRILLKLGWITEFDYTPKKYQINMNSGAVAALVDLFRKIGYL